MNPQPVSLADELRGALARGYCHAENSRKVLDSDLIEAMREEIEALLAQHAVAEPNGRSLEMEQRIFTPDQERAARILKGVLEVHDKMIGFNFPVQAQADIIDYFADEFAGIRKSQHAVAEPQAVLTEGQVDEVLSRLFDLDKLYPNRRRGVNEIAKMFNALLVPAHAAEQPKLSEEQIRFVDKMSEDLGMELFNKGDKVGWAACDEFGHRIRALLTSPVAPPPQQKDSLRESNKLALARVMARRDEAQYVRSSVEAEKRVMELDAEIAGLEDQLFPRERARGVMGFDPDILKRGVGKASNNIEIYAGQPPVAPGEQVQRPSDREEGKQ